MNSDIPKIDTKKEHIYKQINGIQYMITAYDNLYFLKIRRILNNNLHNSFFFRLGYILFFE